MWAGMTVLQGECFCVVEKTGYETEIGKAASVVCVCVRVCVCARACVCVCAPMKRILACAMRNSCLLGLRKYSVSFELFI